MVSTLMKTLYWLLPYCVVYFSEYKVPFIMLHLRAHYCYVLIKFYLNLTQIGVYFKNNIKFKVLLLLTSGKACFFIVDLVRISWCSNQLTSKI